MNYPNFFDTKNSLNLYGLQKDFQFLKTIYNNEKLPKVLLLTGNKGVGKSTLINHLLFSIFDNENYNIKDNKMSENSKFYNNYKKNIFSNIIYLKGSDFKTVKVEDIRNLKLKISQSTISNNHRFIIFDDIELFNINSINALLKIIEEPTERNFFFLINNKSKPLLETIKSRALEIKIILNDVSRLEIIKKLISFYNIDNILDPVESKLSPGNFLKFDYVFREYNISITGNFVDNLINILDLYKKNKDFLFINTAFFLSDTYLRNLIKKKMLNNEKLYEIKNFIFNNLNNFLIYNINQNTLINNLNNKLKDE